MEVAATKRLRLLESSPQPADDLPRRSGRYLDDLLRPYVGQVRLKKAHGGFGIILGLLGCVWKL